MASTPSPAIAIATNWLIFVWAVGISQIVQISLGYFINPLLSVVLGMVVFHERLRTLQWVSVALAAAGVAYLTVSLDSVPWIALSLAATFATYVVDEESSRRSVRCRGSHSRPAFSSSPRRST